MSQVGKPQIPAGDTFTLDFDIVDASGARMPLDGAEIRWLLADSQAAEISILAKDVDNGVTIEGAVGHFSVALDPEDTFLLGGRDYWHQATIKFTDGRVSTVYRGFLSILDTVA